MPWLELLMQILALQHIGNISRKYKKKYKIHNLISNEAFLNLDLFYDIN